MTEDYAGTHSCECKRCKLVSIIHRLIFKGKGKISSTVQWRLIFVALGYGCCMSPTPMILNFSLKWQKKLLMVVVPESLVLIHEPYLWQILETWQGFLVNLDACPTPAPVLLEGPLPSAVWQLPMLSEL